MARGKALMFQGTGSDVGKSLVVAGLCRAFRNQGLAVRPFKPQNMSNNAAVTADGGRPHDALSLEALVAREAANEIADDRRVAAAPSANGERRGPSPARRHA